MKSSYGQFKKWCTYRKTVNELSALSNKKLDDLGIHRADIKAISRQSAM